MNEFLRTREQITKSTEWLLSNGYISHPISCKDWELKIITESLSEGDLLDMGADGGFVLHNAVKKNLSGRKVGVDLAEVTGYNKAEGVEYFKEDLMQTSFQDNSFDTIISASVIEHEVNFERFAKEVSRLLRPGCKLIVSFDYFDPKPNTEKMKLYSLSWNILNKQDVLNLILHMGRNGLAISGEVDWTLQDAVITDAYCSPVAGVSYTFGILSFIKQ